MSREYPLGTVLAITTGRLVATMDDVCDILDYMTGDHLFTHQLPRVAKICGPALLAQHPALRTVIAPDDLSGEEKCRRWVEMLAVRLGDTLSVEPLESWKRRNPVGELFDMMMEENR